MPWCLFESVVDNAGTHAARGVLFPGYNNCMLSGAGLQVSLAMVR